MQLTLCLLVSFADNLCKQFGPKSGPTFGLSLIWIQTVRHSDGIFLKEFYKKVDIEKNQQITKSMQNYPVGKTSLQCYSVLSDILVKNELCIPLERGSNVLSTGECFINFAYLFPVRLKSLCFSVLSTKRQFHSVL